MGSRTGFVVLMACLTALDALAIDSMLPALDAISADLALARANDRHYIITSIFLGFAFGLLVYGVLGDSFGRRRPVMIGIVVFLAGTVICAFAQSFGILIAGRLLQGFGAAGPYVLSLAIVRDSYQGRRMAQTLSLVMMIFMTVPALAPIIGQAILLTGGWRLIFLMLAAFSLLTLIWFAIRQAETLPASRRMHLSVRPVMQAAIRVVTHRQVILATAAQGCVMGAFVAFLSTSQQILQQHYELGTRFPLYFAMLAVSLAIAALFNSAWVIRVGMHRLILIALVTVIAMSLLFAGVNWLSGEIALSGFMIYMLVVYACCGLLFGNLSSLAMSPMGQSAGVASSVIGCLSTLIAFTVGAFIGSLYDNTVLPIIGGFGCCALLALVLTSGPMRTGTVGRTAS